MPRPKGYKHTEETKMKMSKSAQGNKNNLGKHLSEETKRKIKEAHKGKTLSERHRLKLKEAHVGMSGKTHTEETRNKMREACIGEKNHSWNPDLTNEDRIKYRRYPEYHIWRKEVFEKNNYICQKCGKVGGKLEAHHIEGYSFNKELRTTVSNGITFCVQCHKDFHHQYGIESTAEKVKEFLKELQ